MNCESSWPGACLVHFCYVVGKVRKPVAHLDRATVQVKFARDWRNTIAVHDNAATSLDAWQLAPGFRLARHEAGRVAGREGLVRCFVDRIPRARIVAHEGRAGRPHLPVMPVKASDLFRAGVGYRHVAELSGIVFEPLHHEDLLPAGERGYVDLHQQLIARDPSRVSARRYVSVFLTAAFHPASRRSRSGAPIRGSNVSACDQVSGSPASPFHTPVAIPAWNAAPSAVVSTFAGR